jgi:YHS domain-containing protein/thioredoxin-related protein
MSALVTSLIVSILIVVASPDTDQPIDKTVEQSAKVTVESHQPDWLDSVDDAQRLAAEGNLPILLHFDASWCGACRRMEKQVLHDTAVKAILGKRLIGVRVDADRHRDLISRYRVSTLPTEIVIAADGTERSRFVGAVSLQSYLSRLESITGQTTVDDKSIVANSNEDGDNEAEKTRSCLIVRRDGKMVGLGGFSPVALSDNRKWQRGQEEFVVSFQEVEYFLQSAAEVTRFEAKPEQFVPHLHGCDPVELHRHKLARAGAIEFGSFYKGEMFFFASIANREQFQNNPAWFLRSEQQPDNDMEAAELLDMIR